VRERGSAGAAADECREKGWTATAQHLDQASGAPPECCCGFLGRGPSSMCRGTIDDSGGQHLAQPLHKAERERVGHRAKKWSANWSESGAFEEIERAQPLAGAEQLSP